MAAKAINAPINTIKGAILYKSLSAEDGVVSSFCSNFMTSIRGCPMPWYVLRQGPTRLCIHADIFSSARIAPRAYKVINPIIITTQIL